MELAEFQRKAINELMTYMEDDNIRNITLKSPTGSGKTIILTHFMYEYLQEHRHTIFIWLTPGRGELEEQSKEKMDRYIHNAQTKLLADVMTGGFEENDCCFINWEKLYNDRLALRDSERTNFLEWIEKAFNNGYEFKIIIDESHMNFTDNTQTIIDLFKTEKIIRSSATPISVGDRLIDIPEEDVIAAGLIKKLIVINENFPKEMEFDTQTDNSGDTDIQLEFLLDRALDKYYEIKKEYQKLNLDINPLILIQMYNHSELLQHRIENYFSNKGITYENDLALWICGTVNKINLDNITQNNAHQKALIMKQAINTGWDCPRASILVKLRVNVNETFEIQTIGRIRRMPEAKHYDNQILDSCYIYTFDNNFTTQVKSNLDKNAFDAKTLFLKDEFKQIKLTKEQRTVIDYKNPRTALKAITLYLQKEFGLTQNKEQNKIKLELKGFEFSKDIITYALSGNVNTINELSEEELSEIRIINRLSTNYGRDFQNAIGRIAREICLDYDNINTFVRKLFGETEHTDKFLLLTTKQIYAFVINNVDKLRHIFRDAIATDYEQLSMQVKTVSKSDFHFPHTCIFTYDRREGYQNERTKNVYEGYLTSAKPRSSSEIEFENFCEDTDVVDWFYKNGDKGNEYLSVLYLDNTGKQKLFYPDYVISVRGKIWIIETKGGFTRTGVGEDIDISSAQKFRELKRYLNEYNLNGGFVRFNDAIRKLCICQKEYSRDMIPEYWEQLKDVIK